MTDNETLEALKDELFDITGFDKNSSDVNLQIILTVDMLKNQHKMFEEYLENPVNSSHYIEWLVKEAGKELSEYVSGDDLK